MLFTVRLVTSQNQSVSKDGVAGGSVIATALLDEEIADSEMQMQCFLHIQNNRSVPQPVPLLLSVALFR